MFALSPAVHLCTSCNTVEKAVSLSPSFSALCETSDDSDTFSTCLTVKWVFLSLSLSFSASRYTYLSPLCTHLVILLVRCRVSSSPHPANAKAGRSGPLYKREKNEIASVTSLKKEKEEEEEECCDSQCTLNCFLFFSLSPRCYISLRGNISCDCRKVIYLRGKKRL